MVNSLRQDKRKNKIIIAAVGILVLSVLAIVLFFKNKSRYPQSIGLIINNNDYYLEVAQNNRQRKIGLSNRDETCSNCGMVFIFKKEGLYPFWMKDTRIPLDMIWINSQNKIVKMITALETNSQTTYSNQEPAKYVIELPANESLKLKLKIGDTIDLPFDQ